MPEALDYMIYEFNGSTSYNGRLRSYTALHFGKLSMWKIKRRIGAG